ncbi:hypothetical protein L0156_05010 [bacterium]|nr:hypothetical protein [bacterium]
MNKKPFLVFLLLFAMTFSLCFAKSDDTSSTSNAIKPISGQAVRFAKSKKARSLKPPKGVATPNLQSDEESIVEIPTLPLPRDGEENLIRQIVPKIFVDPAAQKWAAPMAMPSPSISFDGINNLDNANAFGFRVLPPDTNGDVGPNHYVQMVNLLVRVFDKTGAPLTAPFKLSSLFAPLGGICSTNDNGDPVVLYDPLADRWLLSQFAFPPSGNPPYHECIAISKTSNPTGAYFLYDFVVPNAEFPDYPKIGVWPDAYYMTANQFFNFGPFDGTGVYAFERTKMLAGDPTASFIYFNLDLASHPEGVGGMLPSDLDGPPPAADTPNTFAYFTAINFGDPADGLRLFDFHVDFGTPANSTFTERPESSYAAPVPVAAFDPTLNSGSGTCPVGTFNFRDDIDQPLIPGNPAASCNAKLDAIADRLMHRMQYRNFGPYETLVVNHTVDVNFTPPTDTAGHLAGVRYYELRRTSPGGPFSVNEQATFSPDSDHRWMGSAAMDSNGNLAVGYSVSSATVYPSIRYAGRLASDPPSGLFQGETTLHTGLGSQGNSASRWGDYSALTVDPSDDCSFWYTTEYYNTTDNNGTIPCSSTGFLSNACWSTRIGSFRFPTCIANEAASPNTLWPPNHKMKNVTINYENGPGVTCSLSVTSDEPEGVTSPDWIVIDSHHVLLRAERDGFGDGRVYTITIECSDANGTNTQTVFVTVPHDQGH